MRYNTVIKMLFLSCFFAQVAPAQKGNLYLRASLGLQSPVAAKTFTEWRRAQVRNNLFYAVIVNSAGLEYYTSNRSAIYAEVFNGQSGYGVGTLHKNDCGIPTTSYSELSIFTAFSYVRLNLGHIYYIKKQQQNNRFHIDIALQYGLGIDFIIPENDAIITLLGTNRCGEVFYLADTAFNIRKTGLVLPLQINFQAFTKKRMSVCLSLFYHAGLTRHADVNVDYTTATYIDRARFISRGSSYGFRVSYPFRLLTTKQKR